MEDCAKGLGIQLPSFSAKGSKATWTVTGPITPTSTTTPVLDSQGSNTLSYTTGLVPCVLGSARGRTKGPRHHFA